MKSTTNDLFMYWLEKRSQENYRNFPTREDFGMPTTEGPPFPTREDFAMMEPLRLQKKKEEEDKKARVGQAIGSILGGSVGFHNPLDKGGKALSTITGLASGGIAGGHITNLLNLASGDQ